MRDEKLLEKLTQIWGVSGYEKAVREAIKAEAEPYADEMWTDGVGDRFHGQGYRGKRTSEDLQHGLELGRFRLQ